ncbi:hypothetical protein [Lacihabitans soyangensis]|uniref:Uncharacterized protein n=1 Tax=Lacihabitans soyangensis TaxID=869394 RepID=A0AAE3KSU4_9BACT|nr:hypothetical protein [Lacihabitans soyangensis]MCP9762984.1 hypothetical protein [Lacihabitans soyangensis]
MIYFFIIIGVLVVYKFIADSNKQTEQLKGEPLPQKFNAFIETLNKYAFSGSGLTTKLSETSYNLYKEGENQIINLEYAFGTLKVIWRYKYFQQELVHKKEFENSQNIRQDWQIRMADSLISEMKKAIELHKIQVNHNLNSN